MSRLLTLALVLAAACAPDKTEMLIRIYNGGLRIPDELTAVAVNVKANDPANTVGYSQQLNLCRAPGEGGCHQMPFSLLLIPGGKQPDVEVDIEVDAVYQKQVLIANGGKFRFTRGATLYMDFVLYPECLGNLSCAVLKQACLHGNVCGVTPTGGFVGNLGSPLDDLAMTLPPDLSVPDMTAPPDMVYLNDFSVARPDFSSSDFASCVAGCTVNTCGNDPCGNPCACTTPNTFCSGTSCVACGQEFQPCCPPGFCSNVTLTCAGTTCLQVDMAKPDDMFLVGGMDMQCGMQGQGCCSGTFCYQPWTYCDPTVTCAPCGGQGQTCCGGGGCQFSPPGLTCNGVSNTCESLAISDGGVARLCGLPGLPCCEGGGAPCDVGICNGGMCP